MVAPEIIKHTFQYCGAEPQGEPEELLLPAARWISTEQESANETDCDVGCAFDRAGHWRAVLEPRHLDRDQAGGEIGPAASQFPGRPYGLDSHGCGRDLRTGGRGTGIRGQAHGL